MELKDPFARARSGMRRGGGEEGKAEGSGGWARRDWKSKEKEGFLLTGVSHSPPLPTHSMHVCLHVCACPHTHAHPPVKRHGEGRLMGSGKEGILRYPTSPRGLRNRRKRTLNWT